jgi:hypothetical protein
MYLDAVLNGENYSVIFNGRREATIAFIKARMDDEEIMTSKVCIGENMRLFTIEEYLNIYAR